MSAQPQGVEILVDGLVTVAAACSWLSVSRSFLYSAMDGGVLPFVKLGRARRIPKRALLDYVVGHLVGATGEHPR